MTDPSKLREVKSGIVAAWIMTDTFLAVAEIGAYLIHYPQIGRDVMMGILVGAVAAGVGAALSIPFLMLKDWVEELMSDPSGKREEV